MDDEEEHQDEPALRDATCSSDPAFQRVEPEDKQTSTISQRKKKKTKKTRGHVTLNPPSRCKTAQGHPAFSNPGLIFTQWTGKRFVVLWKEIKH